MLEIYISLLFLGEQRVFVCTPVVYIFYTSYIYYSINHFFLQKFISYNSQLLILIFINIIIILAKQFFSFVAFNIFYTCTICFETLLGCTE